MRKQMCVVDRGVVLVADVLRRQKIPGFRPLLGDFLRTV